MAGGGNNPAPRFGRSRRFLRERFSPESYLGLHLTIGLAVILLGGWSFSEIAEMLGPAVPEMDRRTLVWFGEQTRPGLTWIARAITFLGSIGFLSSASIACLVLFWWQSARSRMLLLALSMVGGAVLNISLKHFFHRQRPVLENPLVTLTSYGFPSGHTMDSTIFYGLLALIAAHALPSWPARIIFPLLAASIVVLIGATRIYLGAHYLTDVLAAMAAGLIWLSVCWTAVETFRRRKLHRARARL